jgi:hypothetical protein
MRLFFVSIFYQPWMNIVCSSLNLFCIQKSICWKQTAILYYTNTSSVKMVINNIKPLLVKVFLFTSYSTLFISSSFSSRTKWKTSLQYRFRCHDKEEDDYFIMKMPHTLKNGIIFNLWCFECVEESVWLALHTVSFQLNCKIGKILFWVLKNGKMIPKI